MLAGKFEVKDFYYIKGVGISVGKFDGDLEKAYHYIKDFLDNSTVKMESYGHGYGQIKINDTAYEYNPYGIDFNMMIQWAGNNLENFIYPPQSAEDEEEVESRTFQLK